MLPAKRIHDVCSQVDILPSIASIAKVPYYNNTFGRDLFDTLALKTGNSISNEKFAFIIDHDVKTVGLVSAEYYFLKDTKTGKEEMVSVINNEEIKPAAETDSVKKYMSTLTDAWHETAKYLLLNNKKKN
jgi:hypothetical protein